MERLKVFNSIEGSILSAVVFVEDNLELQLNSATITLGVLPTVKVNDAYFQPDSKRYREMLSSLVGKSISGIFALDEYTTEICFDSASTLTVSRNNDLSEPPEILVLEKLGEPRVVW